MCGRDGTGGPWQKPLPLDSSRLWDGPGWRTEHGPQWISAFCWRWSEQLEPRPAGRESRCRESGKGKMTSTWVPALWRTAGWTRAQVVHGLRKSKTGLPILASVSSSLNCNIRVAKGNWVNSYKEFRTVPSTLEKPIGHQQLLALVGTTVCTCH